MTQVAQRRGARVDRAEAERARQETLEVMHTQLSEQVAKLGREGATVARTPTGADQPATSVNRQAGPWERVEPVWLEGASRRRPQLPNQPAPAAAVSR